MSERCPVCGGAVVRTDVIWNRDMRILVGNGRVVSFTPREAEVFDALWRFQGRQLSRDRLAAAAWSDCIDGGPESLSIVSVYLHRVRKLIEPLGLTVLSRSGRSGYALVGIKCADG